MESAEYRCVKGHTDGTYKVIRGVGEDLLPPQHQLNVIRQVGEVVGIGLTDKSTRFYVRIMNT